MMTAHNTLRLCHSGMDKRSLYAFELFLSRVGPNACQISDEESADVAFIDLDNELGPYLLEGHRLLYPARPLIVSTRRPPTGADPLTLEVAKPVGLSAFSAALEQARLLLPAGASGAPAAPTEPALPAAPPALDSRQPSADPISLLRQIEERLSTFYVGSMPDVDLDDLAARGAIYYTPEHFLQGVIARAIAHAREIQRPVRLAAVQIDRDARNCEVGGNQGVEQQLPPRQIPQTIGHPIHDGIPDQADIQRHK